MKCLSNFSIRTAIFLSLACLLTGSALLFIYFTFNYERDNAINEARERAKNVFDLNSAILTQFQNNIRSKMLDILYRNNRMSFDPALMSSLHNLRSINKMFMEASGSNFLYRVSTINSRVPTDEADPFEARLIQAFNADRKYLEYEGIRDIDGKPFYTIMRPHPPVSDSCMTCHSTPDMAPQGLVDIYGKDRGFHWPLGEIVAAFSVSVPLGEAFAAADHSAKLASIYFFVFLCLLLALTGWLLHVLVLAPLRRARDVATSIAQNPVDTIGERIPAPRGRELAEFAQAFNDMTQALARERTLLDSRVAERTGELAEANRKLQALSERDALTGLANRRKFDMAFAAAWRYALRHGFPLAVLLLDVDWFKDYNDRYGHQAGDACLQDVAGVLALGARRSGELAARYGGEEFVIILPGMEAKEAGDVAQRIRQGVEALGIAHDKGGDASVVTISIGVAACVPVQDDTPDGLLNRADAALYRAKEQGRNRVVVF